MATLMLILLSLISRMCAANQDIKVKYECFDQTYSTCHTSMGGISMSCEQLPDPVKCKNGKCQTIGYNYRMFVPGVDVESEPKNSASKIESSISVKLHCLNALEYIHIENAYYVLPKKRINYCKGNAYLNCRGMQKSFCKESHCDCFSPNKNETCEEQVDNNTIQRWRKYCDSVANGNCTFIVPREKLSHCENLTYNCENSFGFKNQFKNCYAMWIKISYSCYQKGDPPTTTHKQTSTTNKYTITSTIKEEPNTKLATRKTSMVTEYTTQGFAAGERKQNLDQQQSDDMGSNVGLIVGVSVAAVVIIAAIIVVLLFVVRKKHPSQPKHQNKPATFVNNVYEDLTASSHRRHEAQQTYDRLTVPTANSISVATHSNESPAHEGSMPECATVNKSFMKKTETHPAISRDGQPQNNQQDEQQPCDFVENTYYESNLTAGMKYNEDQGALPGNNPDDIIENTYYEGSAVDRDNTSNKESSEYYNVCNNNKHKVSKDEMIENVYYESS